MRNTQRVVVGVSLLLALTLLIGAGVWPTRPASADVDPGLTDSLWGEALSPCEAAFGFDPSLRVTIPLHQRERELIHLALEGFIADLEHERVGVSSANPPFELRAGFLGFFIDPVVPTIQTRVGGRVVDEFPTPENEAAMLASIQYVEFGACERNAISIAIENWTVKSGGQMAAHLALCKARQRDEGVHSMPVLLPSWRCIFDLVKKDREGPNVSRLHENWRVDASWRSSGQLVVSMQPGCSSGSETDACSTMFTAA